MTISPADRRAWVHDEDESNAFGGLASYNFNHPDNPHNPNNITIDTSAAAMAHTSDRHSNSRNSHCRGGGGGSRGGNNTKNSKTGEGGGEGGAGGSDDRTSSPTSVADFFCPNAFNAFNLKRGSGGGTVGDPRSGGRRGGDEVGCSDESALRAAGPLETLVQAAGYHSAAACATSDPECGVAGRGSSVGNRTCGVAAVPAESGGGCDNDGGEGSTADFMSAQALFRGNIPGLTSFGESRLFFGFDWCLFFFQLLCNVVVLLCTTLLQCACASFRVSRSAAMI